VVAVAYADTGGSTSVEPKALAEIAWRAGATGVLLDTALKDGPGLCDLMTPPALASWVATSHGFGLMVALAGKLTADDLPLLQDTGADIVGFRGAACERGRSSSIAENKVRLLSASLRSANGAVAPSAFALRLHCNPIATAIPTATRLSTNSATQSGTAKRSQSS
jgi:uncharacterized protein (UPF0264 family)